MWLEPHYHDPRLKPIGKLKTIVPERPDAPDMVLDACLAFAPALFAATCPSLKRVKKELGDLTQLDFNMGQHEVPASWAVLRDEARAEFATLAVWSAELERVDIDIN